MALSLIVSIGLNVFLGLTSLDVSRTARSVNPFDTLRYADAGLYVLDSLPPAGCTRGGPYGKGIIITPMAQLDTCLRRVATLSRTSLRRLMTILNDTSTYRFGPVSCYTPRIAVVYLDGERRVAAYVAICMDCDKVRSWPEIPANVGRTFDDGNDTLRLDLGTRGKTRLWKFLKAHGLDIPLELRGPEWKE
jgi:hypothetical protein